MTVVPQYNYVLITPARNEGPRVENTIKSVISQSIKPMRWVIVNDASTDNTKEIVEQYAENHSFIRHIELKRDGGANFSSKVRAFNTGLTHIADLDYDYIGNLDADISFESDYFELLLRQFIEDTELGLGGGMIVENLNGTNRYRKTSTNSVAGAVQLFRRSVFEKIGGYIAMRYGGVDAALEIMVRMNGWKVRTFPSLIVIHHGPVSMGCTNPYSAFFRKGKINCTLGYAPLFHLVSSILRMSCKPFVIGGLLMLLGYYMTKLRGIKPQLPSEAVNYLHSEQRKRLKNLLKGRMMLVSTKHTNDLNEDNIPSGVSLSEKGLS